ncbi:MAG: phosphate-starvation-inducible PsiE family protein [Coriobacteriia bacterium]|nr:phosphate-starvation-inducible PsiE family protein [Coriobacteriia bacterium]
MPSSQANAIQRYLNKIVFGIEVVVSAALVVLSVLALVTLSMQILEVSLDGLSLNAGEFTLVISTVLEVFILIELFRIAIAYMLHRNVIPTVMEAALVAVARKFVIFGPKEDFLNVALGLSALLLALAASWWLLKQSDACALDDHA